MNIKSECLAIFILASFVLGGAWAGQDSKEGHPAQAAGAGAHPSMKEKPPHAHSGSKHFTPHWSSTLTEDQKLKVDQMHIGLSRAETVYKTGRLFELAKLNALITEDNPNQREIEEMIAIIADMERALLNVRYQHLAEMRAILTREQRISYDMAVLGRGGVDKAVGGH